MFLKCPCACTILQRIKEPVSKMRAVSFEGASHEYDTLHLCISYLCSGTKQEVVTPMVSSSSSRTGFAGLACLMETV